MGNTAPKKRRSGAEPLATLLFKNYVEEAKDFLQDPSYTLPLITSMRLMFIEQSKTFHNIPVNLSLRLAIRRCACVRGVLLRILASSTQFSNSSLHHGRETLGSISGPVKLETVSPTACYCCDVSLELCCPGLA